MLRAAQDGGRRALMLAVLVVGLLAGLVAMHHLSAAVSGPHGAVVPVNGAESAHAAVPDISVGMQRDDNQGSPPASDHGDTGLLHLCLAILTGVAVVVAAMLEWRIGATSTARPPVGSIRPVPAPRAPPPSAPARLALLCVLRT